jgi:hypothetical protein
MGSAVKKVSKGISDLGDSVSRAASKADDKVRKIASTTGAKYIGDYAAKVGKGFATVSTLGLSDVATDIIKDGKPRDFADYAKGVATAYVDSISGYTATTGIDIMTDQATKAAKDEAAKAERDAAAAAAEYERLNRPYYDPTDLERRRAARAAGMYGYDDTVLAGSNTRLGRA